MFQCLQKQASPLFYGAVILLLLNPCLFAQEKEESKPDGEMLDSVCPYKVNENDSVYFQISGYDLKTPSRKINPYVYLRKEIAGKVVKKQSTSYVKGGLSGNMPNTSSYELYFEEGKMISYQIEVWKTFGKNRLYTSGKVTAKDFFAKWRQNADKAKPFLFEFADGDVLTLKFNREESGKFYFRIEKYNLVDRDSIKDKIFSKYFMVDCNGSRLLTSPNVHDKLSAAITNPEDFEFMVKNDPKYTYMVTAYKNTGSNEKLLRVEISSKVIIDKLKAKMAAFPKDSSKWTIEATSEQGNTITLKFAGIRRLYWLKSITVPKDSDARQIAQYANGAQPCIRVEILCTGRTIAWYDCPKNGWDVQFPSDFKVEIRESLNNEYSIQLRDKKTWIAVINLADINNLKDVAFREPVKETLNSMDDPSKAVVINFSPVQ